MGFREVTMLEVKEILRLWLLGVPRKRIAQQLGFDVKTVRRYLGAARARGLDASQGVAALTDELVSAVLAAVQPRSGRPRGADWARCAAQRDFLQVHLDRGVRLTKIRKLLGRRGVVIPYDTLRRYALAELGCGQRAPTVPVADGEPGAEVQLDTGWMGLLERDPVGQRRRFRAWIFTAVRSRHRFVYPVFRETTATAIEACEAAWAYFGGVFKVLIVDNTKAIVTTADPLQPTLVQGFLEYAQARGFTVDTTRVRAPQDKARVERAVATVRDDCFGGERLLTLDDARAHGRRWGLEEYGLRRHSTTQRFPREHFESEEQPALLPAPTTPYDIPLWCDPKVGLDQFAAVAKALYSLPLAYRRRRLRARADTHTVRFYDHGQLIKVHARQRPGGKAIDPADFPAASLACAQRDAAYFLRQAREYGPHVGRFAEALLAGPQPWTRLRRLFKLLSLARKYGPRLDAACETALAADLVDVRRLAELVRLDAQVRPRPTKVLPLARHLRPASQYALPLAARARLPKGDSA